MAFIALILLLTPTAVLTIRHIRENGLALQVQPIRTFFSVLGLVLLAVVLVSTINTAASGLLNPEFFPFRAYLMFLVSGIAFAVVILPDQAIEFSGMPERLATLRLEWLIALPAWLWIAVLFVLLETRYAS